MSDTPLLEALARALDKEIALADDLIDAIPEDATSDQEIDGITAASAAAVSLAKHIISLPGNSDAHLKARTYLD